MRDRRYRTLFGGCLHLTLFFMVLELAADASSYGGLEISLVLLILSFGALLLADCGLHPLKILEKLTMPFRQCRLVTGILAVYLITDFITLLYSPLLMTALQKYKVIVLMLFFMLAMAYYIQEQKQIDYLLGNIAFTGGLCALLSVLNLSVIHLFERHYFRRLSLRVDYNMFGAVLFTALIAGTFLLLKREWEVWQKFSLLALWWGLMGAVIYLSSSRRTWLVTPWCGLFLLGLMMVFRRKLSPKVRAGQLLMTAVGVCFIGFITVPLLEQYMEIAYRQSLYPTEESTAAQRYENLLEPGESKRLLLWQTAWQDYTGFTGKEKWIGRGAGYDIRLYDQTQSPLLQQAYPDREKVRGQLSAHNFMLADLLNGGLIKLTAGLLFWAAAGWTLLVFLKKFMCFGWLYVIELGYVFLSSSISNRYGFLYDKFFWIFLILLCMEIHLEAQGRIRRLLL